MLKLKKPGIIFSMTWPIFVELILSMLMGNIDQVMVAKYSETAVAAVGNANQILNFLALSFNVLCTASIILISQFKGAQREDKVDQIYTLSTIVNLIISLAVSIIIFALNGPIFDLMGVPADVLPETKLYTVITGSFIFLQAMAMTFSAFLRANKFMRQTLIANVVMNLLNIFGNLILVNGVGPIPAMGVTGVAIATTVSRLAGVIIMVYMFIKHVGKKLNIKHLRPFPSYLFKKQLGIGLPSAGENFAYSLSQVVIMSFINLFGTTTITVKVYVSMIAMVTHIFTSAIAQATQVLVGNMLGAKDTESANKRVWKTVRLSMLTSFIASSFILIFSNQLLGMFSSDPEVLRLGRLVLMVDLFLEQGRALNICFVRCLQAAGDIKFPVMMGVISTWVIAVGFAYIFGVYFGLGLIGIWIAMAMDELFRGTCFIFRWRKGGWKLKNLVD